MNKILKTYAVLILSLFVFGVAGDKSGMGYHHGKDFDHEKFIGKLGLDSAQKAAVMAHYKSAKEKQETHEKNMMALKEQLHAAFATHPVDKAAVEALRDQIATAKGEGTKMHIDSKLFLVSQLNADQHKKFAEQVAKKMDKKDKGKKGGPDKKKTKRMESGGGGGY